MGERVIELRPIGRVESSLVDVDAAPRQPDEGAPEAWLVLAPTVADGLAGVEPGSQLLLLTWLHRAPRDVLTVHPRGDPSRPMTGVFNTRSSGRPNPIGLHTVDVAQVDGPRIRVRHLEAVDGTPILDLKPVLGSVEGR
jgi:tRNA-Thr(GGU) m(6)t(6)A37 methyltransferase TsaA